MIKRILALTVCAMTIAAAPGMAAEKKQPKTAKQKPAPTSKQKSTAAKKTNLKYASDADIYKNEGAHFELPFEYWLVMGELKMPGGTGYYGAHFHKVGNEFLHLRNGYNFLRLPDGKYDYRSFGQGMARQLAEGALDKMIAAYPEDGRYKATREKLSALQSEHFTELGEEERSLYRGRLYIHFGKNRYYRSSDKEFAYELDLNTHAGQMNLKMKSAEDPLFFDASNSLKMGGGEMQGYGFYNLETSGILKTESGNQALKGSSIALHLFGQPGPEAPKNEIFMIQMDNGDKMFVSAYYNNGDILVNMNAFYQPAGGLMKDHFDLYLKETESWTSGSSRVQYPVAWTFSGPLVNGKATAKFKESEVMLEEGVGAFWFGPCEFSGTYGDKKSAKKISGKGVCRVTGYDPTKSAQDAESSN